MAAVLLVSCSIVAPDYGEPDPMCGWAPGMKVGWAGRGSPADFGLLEPRDLGRPGAIYVEAEPVPPRQDEGIPPGRQVCVMVSPTRGYAFTVPDGWEAPTHLGE
jgi:hypothetical protein